MKKAQGLLSRLGTDTNFQLQIHVLEIINRVKVDIPKQGRQQENLDDQQTSKQ